MSRPQLQPYVQSASPTGPIVNGGLIDFQDNMHRGVPEYGMSPSMIAAQQQQQGQQPPHSQMMQAAAGVPCGGGFQSNAPQWVSGPASYYHVNGVMYAPIVDPIDQASGGKVSAQTVVEAAAAAHAADGQALREEQDTAGTRVTKQVQAYIRKRGNESYCAGVGDESRKQKMAATAEEMAAARVNSLNAAMPKGASRVDPSIRGRW